MNVGSGQFARRIMIFDDTEITSCDLAMKRNYISADRTDDDIAWTPGPHESVLKEIARS